MNCILTIAGFDPSSGAGITADLKTFQELGVYGLSAITTNTVQNSIKVFQKSDIDSTFLKEQLAKLADDFEIKYLKIGLLGNLETMKVILDFISVLNAKVILDPILISSSGYSFYSKQEILWMKENLFKKIDLLTPNLPELELLTGNNCKDAESIQIALTQLHDFKIPNILLKSGHSSHSEIVDILSTPEKCFEYRSQKLEIPEVHGTGCRLSAALTAFLARGDSLEKAFYAAEEFMRNSLIHSEKIGKGSHFII